MSGYFWWFLHLVSSCTKHSFTRYISSDLFIAAFFCIPSFGFAYENETVDITVHTDCVMYLVFCQVMVYLALWFVFIAVASFGLCNRQEQWHDLHFHCTEWMCRLLLYNVQLLLFFTRIAEILSTKWAVCASS